jgi:hypothetical protein
MFRKLTKAAALTAAVLGAGVAIAPLTASAGAGDANINPTSGTQATTLNLNIPGDAACTGSGANSYRWHAVIWDASVPASSLSFTSNVSAPGGKFAVRLQNTSAANIFNNFPASSPTGAVTGVPAVAMSSIATGAAGSGTFDNGVYNIGVVCTLSGALDASNLWYNTITVTGKSGNNFSWNKGTPPTAPAITDNGTVDNNAINGITFSSSTGDPSSITYSVSAVPQAPVVGGATTITQSGVSSPFNLTAVNGNTYAITVTATNSNGSTASAAVNSEVVAPPACGQAQTFVWTKKASAADLSWSAPTQPAGTPGTNCAAALTGYTLTVVDAATSVGIPNSPFIQTGLTKALTGLDSAKSYNVTLTANYTSPFVTGAALTSNSNTVLPDAYLTQTITVNRPVGALVMTQRCGVHGPLAAVTADPYFGNIPAVVNTNTGPETQARDWLPTGTNWTPGIGGITGETGSVSGGTLPTNNSTDPTRPLSSYPYPTDASGIPNANYPTDCGINLGIGKLITTGPKAGQYFTAQGWINQITVVETRDDDAGWTINGQMGSFTSGSNTFHGNLMGWNPQVNGTSGETLDGYDQVVTAGSAKDPVASSNADGLAKDKKGTLASAAATKGLGIATLDARLRLLIPLTAKAGTFTGTLTFTSV